MEERGVDAFALEMVCTVEVRIVVEDTQGRLECEGPLQVVQQESVPCDPGFFFPPPAALVNMEVVSPR